MKITETSVSAKRVWRHNMLHISNKRRVVCAPDNVAGTNFGMVQPGTHMAKLTSGANSGKWRPCGIAVVSVIATTKNYCDVTDASNIFIGDVVGVYETKEEGAEGTQNATGRNVTAVDKTTVPNRVTFDGAAVTSAVGEYLLVENAYITEGILDQEHDFAVLSSQTASDAFLHLALEGTAIEEQLIGHCPLNAHIMAGGVHRSALLLALDATLKLGELISSFAGIQIYSAATK